MNQHVPSNAVRPRGLSMIELLVAMAIGLVVTLAITRVMISFEGSKRTSTGVSDTTQSGSYSGHIIDRAIRQAGTGYTQRINELFGCRLYAARSGTQVLPPTAPYTGAFINASTMRRLAPVLIEKSAANTAGDVRGDIITVMSGAGGKSEMPLAVSTGAITLIPNPAIGLQLVIDYKVNDLLLIGGDTLGTRPCMVTQVDPAVTPTGTVVRLGGAYYNATVATNNLTDYASGTYIFAAPLGNVATSNPPLFQMFAVGDNATLFSYDLLQTGATAAENAPQAIADSVVEVRALYGIDSNADHTVDYWQDPGASPFRYADLTTGGATALANLKQISAIRLGIILRSPVQEAAAVDAPAPVLFAGVTDVGGASLQITRSITGTAQNFRYRTVELTIPLRNMQFAP